MSKESKETRAQKNFHLNTVGGYGLLLSGACAVVGAWLIVTGDTFPGSVVTLGAVALVYVAYKAFSRVRPGPPDWSEYKRRREDSESA